MVKQKEAVFSAIVAVKGTSDFQGEVKLSKDERTQVQQSLLADFQAGKIEFGGDTTDKAKLTQYVSGLVSNWLRKDKRLNGNTTYVPANPGSRTGSGDESLKAMRALLATATDDEAKAEIQAEIDKRLGQLKPKPVINVDALPESLRQFAPQA